MKKLSILCLLMLSVSISTLRAQNLNSAYFLEGYTYGHQLNPAKDYEREGFVSMPFILGNTNVSMMGNMSVKDYIRPLSNGKLATILHPEFSVSDALKDISSMEKTNVDLRYDLFGMGFHSHGGKGYNFINLGVRTNVGVNVPYGLVEVMKDLQNKDYNIGEMGVSEQSWVELSYGHSHEISKAWRVGGTLKLLLGAASVRANAKNLTMSLQANNKWTVTGDMSVEAGVKNLTWGAPEVETLDDGTTYEHVDFDNMDVNKFGLNGWGLALDLGTEFDLEKQGILDGMKLSASLLDFGFIRWGDVATARNAVNSWEFDGFQNIQIKDGEGESFSDQTQRLGDNLSKLYNLQDAGNISKARMLGATLNIGVEYKLPQYDKLKFGFLSTTRIQGRYSWNEERLSATVSPLSWLEGSINLGLGSFGASFGWVLNVHTKGFSIFAGMDHCVGKFSKQGIPLSSNNNMSIGISFPFGSKL